MKVGTQARRINHAHCGFTHAFELAMEGWHSFFLSVTFPFLRSVAPLVGGATLPLTFAYPYFMWIARKKPRPNGLVWFINMGLGCFAIVLTVLIVIAAAWTLADKALKANFYRPLCQI